VLATVFKILHYLILFSQLTCAVDNIIPISLMGKLRLESVLPVEGLIASGSYKDMKCKPRWFYLHSVCFLFYQK